MSAAENIHYMYNDNGEKTFAVLPIDVFKQLEEAHEEFLTIQAYDQAKKSDSETIPLDQMLKEIEKNK